MPGSGVNNTVSFRQGSNVEFEGPSFVNMSAINYKSESVGDFSLFFSPIVL